MTVWTKTNRGWVDESNPDGPAHATLVMKDGDTTRVPTQFRDSAGGQQPVLDALADRASDLRLDQATRVAARDALDRHYASLAAVPTIVLKYPGLFDEATRRAVLKAPVAAGRDSLEAVYASYDASVRDSWRNGQAPDRGTLDEVYAAYDARLRDSWQHR